jgi:MarR family transcriptional regulator, transcriptional regulator for hemolysin
MHEIEERFAEALHGAARAWRHAVDRRLKSRGLSQASWAALAVASSATAPLSQSQLAQRLGVEGATTVAMVDRLVKAGLLERQPSKSDRRVNRLIVTDAGGALVEVVRAEAAAARRKLLTGVDPKQLTAAAEFLETIQKLVERARSR